MSFEKTPDREKKPRAESFFKDKFQKIPPRSIQNNGKKPIQRVVRFTSGNSGGTVLTCRDPEDIFVFGFLFLIIFSI